MGVSISFGFDSSTAIEPQPFESGLSRQQPPGRPQEPVLFASRATVAYSSSVFFSGVISLPLISAMVPLRSSVMKVRAASKMGL